MFVSSCQKLKYFKLFIEVFLNQPSQIADWKTTAVVFVSALKSPRLSPIYVNMNFDVWQYVTHRKGTQSEHRGHYLFDKDDLIKLKYLPVCWWYCLNNDGEGIAIDFPVKAKPILSWSQKNL